MMARESVPPRPARPACCRRLDTLPTLSSAATEDNPRQRATRQGTRRDETRRHDTAEYTQNETCEASRQTKERRAYTIHVLLCFWNTTGEADGRGSNGRQNADTIEREKAGCLSIKPRNKTQNAHRQRGFYCGGATRDGLELSPLLVVSLGIALAHVFLAVCGLWLNL